MDKITINDKYRKERGGGMKTVFVTGVNGLLGTNLTHLLLKQGYFVKALVRDKRRYKGVQDPALHIIEGDLFDDLSKIMSGVDYVIHTAAVTSQNLPDISEYLTINCNATIQLFHTAVKCKVKRFIFVSTVNTMGSGSLDNPGSEDTPVAEPFISLFYARSKKAAEDHLLGFRTDMDTIIVNPAFMLGAFDTKPSSGKIILMGWRKRVIFYPPGGKNFVHVEDVAQGIINALGKGKSGEKYLLGNENLTFKEFFSKLNKVASQKPLMIQIPKPVLMTLGLVGDLLRLLKVRTNLSSVNMKILCLKNYYINTKSATELGVTYTPVDKSIADAINYFNKIKNG